MQESNSSPLQSNIYGVPVPLNGTLIGFSSGSLDGIVRVAENRLPTQADGAARSEVERAAETPIAYAAQVSWSSTGISLNSSAIDTFDGGKDKRDCEHLAAQFLQGETLCRLD